eukprot:5862312-Amphidinium_carterae.1
MTIFIYAMEHHSNLPSQLLTSNTFVSCGQPAALFKTQQRLLKVVSVRVAFCTLQARVAHAPRLGRNCNVQRRVCTKYRPGQNDY